jgi:hypothetical protein
MRLSSVMATKISMIFLYVDTIFSSEDGGDVFLRNVGIYLQVLTALLSKRPTWTVKKIGQVIK